MFIAIAVESTPPLVIVVTRLSIAGVAVAIMARYLKLRLPGDRRTWMQLFWIGVTGNALPFFLISWGQTEVPSGLTGIFMATNPFFTIVLARLFTADGAMTWNRILGLMCAFGGVIVLMAPSLFENGFTGGTGPPLLNQLAVIGGAGCFAVNAVLARRLPPISPFVSGSTSMLMASVVMLPFMLIFNPIGSFSPTNGAMMALLGQSIWCTALPTLVFFHLVGRVGPVFISTVNYFLPLMAVLWGVIFLAERPGVNAAISLGLVIAGLALANMKNRDPEDAETA